MRNAENAATMPNVYIYDVVSSCPSVASTPNSRITAGRALVSMLWLTEATKVPTNMATSTTFGLNCFSTNGMPRSYARWRPRVKERSANVRCQAFQLHFNCIDMGLRSNDDNSANCYPRRGDHPWRSRHTA